MLKNSNLSVDFHNLRWEMFGCHRVVLWDVVWQPSLSKLETLTSESAVQRSKQLKHDARRREWLAARALSHALTGFEPSESSAGVPLWPDSWLGSISHKSGHVALWVSRWGDFFCGVDLEESREFDLGLTEKVMNGREIEIALKGVGDDFGSLVFSSKEAIYKALCPLVGRLFYFEAAELIDVVGGAEFYLLTFSITENLCSKVPMRARVQVHAKRLQLNDKFYWLAFATFPRFGYIFGM